MFTRRIADIEPSGIRRILNLAGQVSDPVDLSIGQPDYDVPDNIKQRCIEAISAGHNRYAQTLGIPELRQALIQDLNKRGARFEDLIVTNGAAGAITLFFLALVEQGDEIAITDPWFLNYRHMITLCQAEATFIDTYPDFRIREEALDGAVGRQTKAIVVNSPANPTGLVYTREEIELLVDRAKKWDCWIISDEVYHTFVYDQVEYVSPSQIYDKTLIVDSFSKSAGMPGWRLGYGTGPKELIQKVVPLQQYLFGCAPTPVQHAGVLCAGRDLTEDLARLQKKRDMVYQGLKDCYPVERPNGAFYIFPQAPGDDCYPFIERAIQNKLFVSPGDTFSRHRTHFRISYAVPEETLKRGIEILRILAGTG